MPPIGHLRPLGLGEILDRAFALYRGHFVTLFSTALLGFLPILGFAALFLPALLLIDPEHPDGGVGAMAAMGGAMLVGIPLILAGTVLAWGALTHQLSEAYLGGEVSVRSGFRAAWRRLLPLTGVSFLALVAMMIGFVLCFVPGVLAMIVLFAVFPAVVVEGRGPMEAIERSRQLARGAWGPIFLTFLVILLISWVPGMGLWTLMAVGLAVAGATESEGAALGVMVVYQLLSLVVSALTTPFLATGTVLLYYDRRVRSEALDLEMAADALRPSAG
jgi:hypothetical protein